MADKFAGFRSAAQRLDREGLNGRPAATTAKAIRQIVDRIAWKPEYSVADIGCGDGLLLASIPQVRSRVGIAPTPEEVQAVRQLNEGSGIVFEQGLADAVPLPDASYDVVVCNSVLMILSFDEVVRSLEEFYRICKPGGTVYIGRIHTPESDAPSDKPSPALQRIANVVRSKGLGGLLVTAIRKLAGRRSGTRKAAKPTAPFKATADRFVGLCTSVGFEVVDFFDPDPVRGRVTTRYDYVLQRPYT